MKSRIMIDENIPLLHDVLKKSSDVFRFSGRDLKNKDIIDFDPIALVVRSTTKVNKELLNNTNIKFVGTATSGTDHIDLNYLQENKIDFAEAAGSNANSVAEYVIYSILKWALIHDFDLNQKSIAIIGYGNIGKIVAKYSMLMGLKVYVNDPPLKDNNFEFPSYCNYLEINEITNKADIITNHVPLTKTGKYKTHNLLDNNFISSIKSNSLFIHASRGGVIDEKELLRRLDANEIIAAIDCWADEPNINEELAKKCILATPHIAGYSRDGKLRGTKAMADALKDTVNINIYDYPLTLELVTYQALPEIMFSQTNELHKILSFSRKLESDTEDFLEICDLPKEQKKDYFDLLRKNYPERREVL